MAKKQVPLRLSVLTLNRLESLKALLGKDRTAVVVFCVNFTKEILESEWELIQGLPQTQEKQLKLGEYKKKLLLFAPQSKVLYSLEHTGLDSSTKNSIKSKGGE